MAQPNTLPAQADRKPVTLRQRLDQMTPEFKKALPGHIPAERFVRTVQTAIQMNPQIAKACETPGGMQSLLAACTKAATDGLILDGREATLVTFRQKVSERNEKDRYEDRVQYIPMVAGLMKKARNSGEIASIAAHVVHKNDKFAYVLGDDERIEHEPTFDNRGAPIAVYAIVRLKDGSMQREVMDKAAVMRIAGQSKNPSQYDPASGKNYGEWWRKTVIRRISKYLPSSSDRDEFMQAVERIDEEFEYEATNGGEVVQLQQPTTKKRGGAAAALKDVTPKQAASVEQNNRMDHDPETGEIIEHDDDGQDMDDYRQQSGDDI
jgi:recombination protein RecT